MKEDKSKRKLGVHSNSVFHSSELFVIDWLPASFVVKRGAKWLKSYFDSYSLVGNYVVYHNPTSWKGVYYSSKDFPPAAEWEFDPLSRVLSEAEARGLAVLVGYHWVPETPEKMWIHPSKKEIESAKKVISEIYELYSKYKSLKGYYAVWEPGDLSDIDYYRETCNFIKELDGNLLTAAAPYVFSSEEYYGGSLPLIYNALAGIESLDIVIAQSAVAVYPYPPHQGREHLLLAKARLGSTKIVLGHVETFGRRFIKEEQYIPENLIKSQVLSEAIVYGVEGITTFIYAYLLDEPTGKNLKAYTETLEIFRQLSKLISSPPDIALFLPLRPEYWVTAQRFLKLSRKVGLEVTLIQLPISGEVPEGAAAPLIVLADPPELEEREVRFLEEHVKKGGALLVIGYPPAGLRKLLGIEGRNVGKYGAVKPIVELRRNAKDAVLEIGYKLVYCPTLLSAKPLAILRNPLTGYGGGYQPGAYAATLNKYRKGLAIFSGIPYKTLLTAIPSFLLDLVDLCLEHSGKRLAWDFQGLNELTDTVARDDMLLVLNHGEPIKVKAKYAGKVEEYKVLGSPSRVKLIDNAFEIELEGAQLGGVQIL